MAHSQQESVKNELILVYRGLDITYNLKERSSFGGSEVADLTFLEALKWL